MMDQDRDRSWQDDCATGEGIVHRRAPSSMPLELGSDRARVRLVRGQPASDAPHRWLWDIALRRRIIGYVILERFDAQRTDYAIGIYRPRDRGRGYGAVATRLALDYAFTTLKLPRVGLTVRSSNARAIACYAKCGFQPVARVYTGDAVIERMVCPNPTLPQPAPLTRSLVFHRSLLRGRRVQLRRADTRFLGITPGDPVAVEGAAGHLILQPFASPSEQLVAVTLPLPRETHEFLLLEAAYLGLTVSTFVGELIEQEASPSPRQLVPA